MAQAKSVWITYAWDDNKDGDVDFVAQELIGQGLDVKLDHWNLTAGKRLWEQIEYYIQDPSKSDGWLIYATQKSLSREACKEEYAYALERALHTRGGDFPVIALFPAPVDRELIPAGIKARLYLDLTDPDWKERVVAAVERREPAIKKLNLEPYALTIHKLGVPSGEKRYAIEVRPRVGTWTPFIAGIPLNEKERVSPQIFHGPARRVPNGGILINCGETVSDDKKLWLLFAANEATQTQSYYIMCRELPSFLVFGVNGGQPQYQVSVQA
ncbi:MAG: toll/interleukin-1 receptor domain-containing protein [Dehalococcoidales bacterium]|nr:toll/interleukin-1 receptor domain-containing protein [Dehalococcoidales bacterium]